MRHRQEWVVALVLSVSHGAQHFFSRLVPPLIPILVVALGLPLWQLGLLVSVYSLGSGLGQTPFGILSDRYDRRFILPPGLAILGFGYVVFGLAPTLGTPLSALTVAGYAFSGPFLVMVLAMAISGVGDSVTHPTGYPLISENMGESRKGRALGLWGSAAKAGDAAAPALIGVLILVLAWHEILFVLGLLGVGYAVVLFAVLRTELVETRPPEHASRTDLTEEERVDVWSTDRRVFIYPIIAILLFFIARMVATKGVNTFVPAFIVDVYGYSLSAFGYTLAPESFANFYFSALLLTAAFVQLWTGALTDRSDHRKVLVAFLLVTTVALGLLSFVTLSPLPLLIVLLVVGAGLWGINPARDALISDITPPEREGRTFGYLWTVAQVIGALSPVLIGYIAGITGIQDSFKWLAVATLAAAVAIGLLFSDQVYVDADAADATGTAD